MAASSEDRRVGRGQQLNPMYDNTYHADQIICQNLTEITPSSVLGALRRANRERQVFGVCSAWTPGTAITLLSVSLVVLLTMRIRDMEVLRETLHL